MVEQIYTSYLFRLLLLDIKEDFTKSFLFNQLKTQELWFYCNLKDLELLTFPKEALYDQIYY